MTSDHEELEQASAPRQPFTAAMVPKLISDNDRVALLKAKANRAMSELCLVMDECAAAGFMLRWQSISPNVFLKHEPIDLHLLKRF